MVGLAKKAKQMPRDLTQVEMRKLELARAMAAEPKLLIADESMAGLSHSEIEDILKLLMELNARGITIILIEHIMTAVMSFSQRLVVLVSGKKIADGDPQEVVRDKRDLGRIDIHAGVRMMVTEAGHPVLVEPARFLTEPLGELEDVLIVIQHAASPRSTTVPSAASRNARLSRASIRSRRKSSDFRIDASANASSSSRTSGNAAR
jgi:ABC-type multidrug transport system ATPase subunit